MPRLPRSRLGPAALIGFAVVAWIGMQLLTRLQSGVPRPRLEPTQWVVLVVGVVLGAHVVLLIHEIGHVLGGWLAGYRLRDLAVGPVRLTRSAGRLHVVANRRLADYGGLVRMEPGRADESRWRTAILLAAGPAASLLLGAALSTAARGGFGGALFRDYIVNRLTVLVAVGSVIVGLANLIPVSFSGRRSDGAELWARLVDREDVIGR